MNESFLRTAVPRSVALLLCIILLCCPFIFSCATAPSLHGTMGERTHASEAALCEHRVPGDVCVRCEPSLAADFERTGDWCGEHDVPESQCYQCHADLSFEPLPKLEDGADLAIISRGGADVERLEAHLVAGKVTVFDFYANWCVACRKIDRHVFGLLNERDDLAVRKLDLGTWDTPLAKRYMKGVTKLPYVIVYGKDGRRVAAITGVDLPALDRAIAEGAAEGGTP